MCSIQDIRALELQITDIVDDYVEQRYNEDDFLAISRRCSKIVVKADAKEKIKVGKTTELYPLKDLVFAMTRFLTILDQNWIYFISSKSVKNWLLKSTFQKTILRIYV